MLLVPLFAGIACGNKDKGDKKTADTKASASPPTSATAAASAQPSATPTGASSAEAPTDDLGAVPSRKIPAGPAPNGTWTIEYSLERFPGDQNLDWSGAVAHCQEKGKELCLETQWQRACELDPNVGKLESWTLTADFPGSAVRGGADGCKARVFKKIKDKSPTRVGLCCDRAIAMSNSDETGKSDEFRTKMTKRILALESAITKGTLNKLADEFAPKVSVDGVELERAGALTKLSDPWKKDATRLVFYDHCNIKKSTDAGTPPLFADCGVVLRTMGSTQGFPQRIAFDTDTGGAIVYVGDPKAMKPKEKKEHVTTFLPSE